METTKHTVSARQFFVMMFVSHAALSLFTGSRSLGGGNLLEGIFSCGLAQLVGGAVMWPILLLQRRCPGLPLPQAAEQALGKWGKLVSAAYLLYLAAANGAFLGLFQIFLQDTVNPEFSASVTIVLLLLTAAYGAWRGIECVARCAGVVFVLFLLGTGLVFCITAARFESENLRPVFYDGWGQTLYGAAAFLARTSVYADMAVLLPFAKGVRARHFWGWALGCWGFIAVLLLLLAGCLGPYADTQNFPVSAITEVRSMQRLDAVFIGVWIMALIVRMGSAMAAGRACFAGIFPKSRPGVGLCMAAALMLAAAFATAESRSARMFLLGAGAHLAGVFLCGAALPLAVFLPAGRQKSKGKGGAAHESQTPLR